MVIFTHSRSRILFALLLLSCCTSNRFSTPSENSESEVTPVQQPIEVSGQILSDTEQLKLELTRTLLNPISIRELGEAEDPVEWMAAWWDAYDPTPGTLANEAFYVYQQRAAWLRYRFPDAPLPDLPEPWRSFLRFGYWDEILTDNTFIQQERLRRTQSGGRPARTDLGTAGRLASIDVAATQVLVYQTPEPFQLSILRDEVIEGARGLTIPSLEGVWDLLEDPGADADRRKQALTTVSWYELPEIAERLLTIPESFFTGLEDELETCFRRLTIRRAYCMDTRGAQRLAAITAAGADAGLQLSRTLTTEYPASQFFADLAVLTEEYFSTRRSAFRGLHPALRDDPEALLTKLDLQFHSEESVTGWDWRGDMALVYGPPNSIIEAEHLAHYVFGQPAVYRVTSGILGTVDAVITTDPVDRYVRDLREMIRTDRSASRVAADELMAMIPEATAVSDALIVQLNRLIPPSSRRIHYGMAELAIDITADVITFPNLDGSIEIFASVGIPYGEVFIQSSLSTMSTQTETSCLLFDNEGELVISTWHDEGFSVERPQGSTESLYLVDSFNFTTDPGEYILYCSVRDPVSEKATGRLFLLDLQLSDTPGPVISPIALAATIEPGETEGIFQRGEYQILPYPGRSLLFSEEIWLYSEISNLALSEFGSYSWQETYFIVPAREDMGIISFTPGMEHTTIRPHAERYIEVDLSSLEGEYGGALYIVVMVTDTISGQSALAAAFFRIFRP
ncbi:hypothetical protein ACFL6T_03530 [Candidatus Zixiibacteriota bacterium]